MRKWTTFKPSQSRYRRSGVRVMLNKRKELIFSEEAFDRLGKPEAVKLMFDVGYCLIGVKAEDPTDPDSVKMQHVSGKRVKKVGAGGFCSIFNIHPVESCTFTDITIEEGVMVLDFKSVTRDRQR